MRKTMLLLGVVAALSLSNARMSSAEGFSFGLQAGAAIPMGDYGEALGIGPSFGVFGDFPLNPQVAVGADIVGNFHGISGDLKDDLEALGVVDPDFSFTVIQFGGHVKWRPAPTGLWLMGGLAMYQGSSKFESDGIEETSSDTKFGFNLGGGFDFPMSSSMNLGIGATFHSVSDAIDGFEDDDETVSAQWVGVAATLTFLTTPR